MARSWIYEKGSPTGGSSSGSSQTPWLSDIDGNQHNLHNASLVSVAEDFTAPDKKQSTALFPDKLVFYNNNTSRWAFAEEGAETGSNVGSDLHLFAYDDTGAFLRTQMSFIRSTGETILNADQGAEIITQAGYGIEFTTDYLALPTSTAYNSLRIPQGGIDCAGIYLSSHASPYWGGFIDFPSLAGALNFPVALAGHAFGATDVLLWASTSNGTPAQLIGQHLCCNAWIDAAAGFVTAQGYHMLSHANKSELNGPVSTYGALAHKSGSTYWFFDPTVPDWKTIDFAAAGTGAVPGGVDQSVQYKVGSVFTGDGNIKWDYTQKILNIVGTAGQQGIYVTNAYVFAQGGFNTSSTSDNAIQAPSGGLTARKAVLTASSGTFSDASPIALGSFATLSGATAGSVFTPNDFYTDIFNSTIASAGWGTFDQMQVRGNTYCPDLRVINVRPYFQATGTTAIPYLTGVGVGAYFNASTGPITNYTAFLADPCAYFNGATTQVTNFRQFWARTAGAAGFITYMFGLAVEGLTSGAHNFAIYTNQLASAADSWAMYHAGDASSYCGGRLGVQVNPAFPLDVKSAAGAAAIHADTGYILSDGGFNTPSASYQAIQAPSGGLWCAGIGIVSSSISPYKGGYIDLPRLQGGINFPAPLLNASFPDGWTDVLLWASSANQPPAAKIVLTTHLCCNAWINAASGFVTAQNVHMKAHASTSDLNPPGGGYGVFGFQGNSTYYYWDDTPSPTLPAGWKTIDFNAAGSQTPWLTDINGNGKNLYSVSKIAIGAASPLAPLHIYRGFIFMQSLSLSSRPAISTTRIDNEISGGSALLGDDGFLRLSAGGGSATTWKAWIDLSGYGGSNPDLDRNIVFGVGTERMRINLNGYVGINNPGPTTWLHVKGTSNSAVAIECEQGFIQSNGGLYVDVATNYNSIQTVGGIVALGRIGVFPQFTPDLGSGLTGVTGLFVTSNTTNNLLVDCYDSANDPARVPGFIGRRAYYTGGLPGSGTFQNLPSGLTLMAIGGRGSTTAGFVNAATATITFATAEAWTASTLGTEITFNVTPILQASRYAKMWLRQSGMLEVRGIVYGENSTSVYSTQQQATQAIGLLLDNGNLRLADSNGGGAVMFTAAVTSANLPVPTGGVGGIAYNTGSTFWYYNGSSWGTVNFATTGAGVTSVNGMSGPAISIADGTGVTHSNGSNTVTISIGQAVATSNAPTFAGLTANGTITANGVIQASNPGGIIFQNSGGSNFQVNSAGVVSLMEIHINGILSVASDGKWVRTVQTDNHVYGGDFGIIGGGVSTVAGNYTGYTDSSGGIVTLVLNGISRNVRIIGGIICNP